MAAAMLAARHSPPGNHSRPHLHKLWDAPVPMRIAVDVDDVTMDFWAGVCRSVNIEYGTDLDPVDTPNWDDNALKKLQVFGAGRTWWDWLQERDWIWHTFQPVAGAIGGIATLRQQGHFVEALTSKPAWAEWTVWKWLGKWRPPFNSVTIVPTGEKKTEWSDAELLVDDRDVNIREWVEAGRQGVVYSRPWSNVDSFERNGQVAIARSWSDVLDCVAECDKIGRFVACR